MTNQAEETPFPAVDRLRDGYARSAASSSDAILVPNFVSSGGEG